MREIGSLPTDADAKKFKIYLDSIEISSVITEDDDQFTIWVHDEDKLTEATESLKAFRASPHLEKFTDAIRDTERLLIHEATERLAERAQQGEEAASQRLRSRPTVSLRKLPLVSGVLVSLIILTIVGRGSDQSNDDIGPTITRQLSFADSKIFDVTGDQFVNIKQGEIWRLITPVFSYGPVFSNGNDPGQLFLDIIAWLFFVSTVEYVMGTRRLAVLCLFLAIVANFGQAISPLAMGGGVQFGGLSPVIVGLIGFTWIRSQIEVDSGFDQSLMGTIFVMAYTWLCLTNPSSANAAIIIGLTAGVSLGLLSRPSQPVAE